MPVDARLAGEQWERRVLPSGAVVTLQHVPATYSVVLGVFVHVGSRDEDPAYAGITHFVEHMVFKGTERRNAYDIALALERVGASIEAHTTKEYTCFYTRVLHEHLDLALDVISDLVLHPTHDPEDVELEKGVVLEEIHNVFDTPDDLLFEILAEKLYGDHPMARPILGTPESVARMTSEALHAFMRRHYVGGNVVISMVGDLDVDAAAARIEAAFPFAGGEPEHASLPAPATRGRVLFRVDEKLTQEYLALGCTGVSYEHDDRYPLLVVSTLMGGGMSSRLFQSVREKAGLCYAVNSFADFARDSGSVGTFMAVSPEKTEAALNLVWKEYDRLRREGIAQRELDDTKDQLKGSMILGMENIASKMARLAKNEIYFGRQESLAEVIQRLDAVDLDDIARVADRYFNRDATLVLGLGPVTAL